jgi:L-amino acid N-acyltransferase YncA
MVIRMIRPMRSSDAAAVLEIYREGIEGRNALIL